MIQLVAALPAYKERARHDDVGGPHTGNAEARFRGPSSTAENI